MVHVSPKRPYISTTLHSGKAVLLVTTALRTFVLRVRETVAVYLGSGVGFDMITRFVCFDFCFVCSVFVLFCVFFSSLIQLFVFYLCSCSTTTAVSKYYIIYLYISSECWVLSYSLTGNVAEIWDFFTSRKRREIVILVLLS